MHQGHDGFGADPADEEGARQPGRPGVEFGVSEGSILTADGRRVGCRRHPCLEQVHDRRGRKVVGRGVPAVEDEPALGVVEDVDVADHRVGVGQAR